MNDLFPNINNNVNLIVNYKCIDKFLAHLVKKFCGWLCAWLEMNAPNPCMIYIPCILCNCIETVCLCLVFHCFFISCSKSNTPTNHHHPSANQPLSSQRNNRQPSISPHPQQQPSQHVNRQSSLSPHPQQPPTTVNDIPPPPRRHEYSNPMYMDHTEVIHRSIDSNASSKEPFSQDSGYPSSLERKRWDTVINIRSILIIIVITSLATKIPLDTTKILCHVGVCCVFFQQDIKWDDIARVLKL